MKVIAAVLIALTLCSSAAADAYVSAVDRQNYCKGMGAIAAYSYMKRARDHESKEAMRSEMINANMFGHGDKSDSINERALDAAFAADRSDDAYMQAWAFCMDH